MSTNARRIDVIVEGPPWRELGRSFPATLRRGARAAWDAADGPPRGGLAILLADDDRLEALNRQFRGKSGPTNVLSFPAGGGDYLGDIAIAHGVTAREARAAAKSIHDHALHLAVHGVLHLLGFDHETAREARIMEPLETAILAKLGIADPYAARVRSGRRAST